MANKVTDVFQHINIGSKEDCWNWKRDTKGGGRDNRPYFDINGRKELAYRVVYELTFGYKLPSHVLLRHSCDNKRCCNPWHLIPGTHEENMADMRERERHGLPKLAVKAIKKLLEDEVPQEVIAKRYGISREAVSAIATGRSHKEG